MNLYCIDTSAIIDAYREMYPPDVFPDVWDLTDSLISRGRLLAPRDVLIELERRDDDVLEWAKRRRDMFHEVTEDVQLALAEVAGRCGGLVNPHSTKNMADPVVIAMAMVRGATVVTHEKPNSITAKNLKIPDACRIMGVRCGTFLDVLRGESYRPGWLATPTPVPSGLVAFEKSEN